MCGCVVCGVGCDWVCVFVLYIVVRSEQTKFLVCMTKPPVGYWLNEKESSLIPTVIEFLIENDQVQKISEVFMETQTPVRTQ